MVTVDSYPESNQSSETMIYGLHPSASSRSAVGQSFTCGSTTKITSAKFYLKKVGSPTGNAHAVLYAHSGTYGTSSVPTGDPLATSDDFDVSDLTTSLALVSFAFSGDEQYEMQADTKYCIVYENPTSGTINLSNYIKPGLDVTAPTHGGNYIDYYSSGWHYTGSDDTIFYVISGVGPETHTPSDTAKASDGLITKAGSVLSDTAKASDELTTIAKSVFGDTAKASDIIAFVKDHKEDLADTAKATDSPGFKPKIPLSDLAKATDLIEFIKIHGEALADTAKASDSIAFKVFHSIEDTAKAQDIIFPNKLTLTDVAKASDSVTYSFIVGIETPTENVNIYR